MERGTWTHSNAVWWANLMARSTGIRHAVIRRDGEDSYGPYRWVVPPTLRAVPHKAAGPCS